MVAFPLAPPDFAAAHILNPRREALRAALLERRKLDVHTKAETRGDGTKRPAPRIRNRAQIAGSLPFSLRPRHCGTWLLAETFAEWKGVLPPPASRETG